MHGFRHSAGHPAGSACRGPPCSCATAAGSPVPIRAMRPCRGATLYHAADGLNWKRLDHWLTDAALSRARLGELFRGSLGQGAREGRWTSSVCGPVGLSRFRWPVSAAAPAHGRNRRASWIVTTRSRPCRPRSRRSPPPMTWAPSGALGHDRIRPRKRGVPMRTPALSTCAPAGRLKPLQANVLRPASQAVGAARNERAGLGST